MTVHHMMQAMSVSEFLQWQIFHNSEHWKMKIADTPEGRSKRILNLIMKGK